MSQRFLTLLVALVASACSCNAPGIRSENRLSLDFEGKAPLQGWVGATGAWSVVEDETAPSAKHALAQTADRSSRDFNLVLVHGSDYQDLDLSVAFRSMAGEIDQGGGPVWRAQDADNYYVARYNPLEDNYRVYVVEAGHRRQLLSADIDPTDGWHTLRITMTGDQIRCYYDGALSLEVQDSTFSLGGQIGLWTKADAQTRFDDMRVR